MADIPIKLPDFSRRTFVKGAAATAAAAGLFGTSTWLAHESAEAAGEQVSESVAYCWHKTHCQGACGLRCTVRDGRLALLQTNLRSSADRLRAAAVLCKRNSKPIRPKSRLTLMPLETLN